MENEATQELSPVQGSVDLNQLLHVSAPSEEAGESGGERSNEESTNEESTSQESQWETRLRGLQAAKDREIAEIRRQASAASEAAIQARQLNETYENMMLNSIVQTARQTHGEAGAQQVQQSIAAYRAQQAYQQQQQQLMQERNMLQPAAAEVMAYRISQDPKYSGVRPEQLMEWAPFGPQAMLKAAEALVLNSRAAKVDQRKKNGTDKMGGGTGGAGDVTSTMSGSDLISFALKNTRKSSDRWS